MTRATARTPLPRRSREIVVTPSSNGHAKRTIDAYSFRAGTRLPFDVVPRAALTDAAVAGPMIVSEETTTTYVDVGFDVAVDPTGSLILRDQAARGT